MNLAISYIRGYCVSSYLCCFFYCYLLSLSEREIKSCFKTLLWILRWFFLTSLQGLPLSMCFFSHCCSRPVALLRITFIWWREGDRLRISGLRQSRERLPHTQLLPYNSFIIAVSPLCLVFTMGIDSIQWSAWQNVPS